MRAAVEGGLVAAAAFLLIGLNTRLNAPPRFDGAGYAVLAEALSTGQGYREIDRPDRPPHAHYPPAYPIALATLWRITGRSAAAAHAFSWACTVLAVLAGWLCFRKLYGRRIALVLGLALACNWTWGRAGGQIQSEPLFLLVEMVALYLALGNPRPDRTAAGLALGAVLGIGVLTRHVGVAVVAAVLLDLGLRNRPQKLLAATVMVVVLLVPWAAWVAMVRQNTQLALLARGGLAARLAGNAVFYLRRIPDQVTGPFVEVATVFGHSGWVAGLATAWAVLATGVVLYGWFRCLRSSRRRLMGLVPLCTLGLLLIWPFTEAGRFLIPLVPFVLAGALEGLARLALVGMRTLARRSDFGRTKENTIDNFCPTEVGPTQASRGEQGQAGLRRGRARRYGRHARIAAALAILFASLPYTAYSLRSGRGAVEQRAQREFDLACQWIVEHGMQPGPIMTRQPGEVYWLTGRTAVLPPGDDPAAIERVIDRDSVTYLLVDEARYARAPENPLRRFVDARPGRVHQVWPAMAQEPVFEADGIGAAAWPRMAIYAVSREHPVSGLGPRR